MVVTDLHGDWDAYQRYRDRFVDLQATGRVDGLIFTGDLIHAEYPHDDRSLEIILDVLALRISYSPAIIYLCGNHELPHIYGMGLAKGQRVYTPDFEKVLTSSGRRAEVIALFDSLPFYLRTQAGVSLTHAGAPAPIATPTNALRLFNWDHQALLNWADEILTTEDVEALRQGYVKMNNGIPYHILASYFLDVSGPDDPRYDDLLRGFIASNQSHFDRLLWPALFTRCEKQYGLGDYRIFLDALLKELSVDFSSQQVLVAGHITLKGGHQIIAGRHLRLASGKNATPPQAGQYLLFDTAQPGQDVEDLVTGLGSVYK
jgi:hypothetical protein